MICVFDWERPLRGAVGGPKHTIDRANHSPWLKTKGSYDMGSYLLWWYLGCHILKTKTRYIKKVWTVSMCIIPSFLICFKLWNLFKLIYILELCILSPSKENLGLKIEHSDIPKICLVLSVIFNQLVH
jgi:hypothetical protein